MECYQTPKGPCQKTICSLGSLEPRPREEWLQLARKIEASLVGRILTQVMTLNSLIAPTSEHAMPDRINPIAFNDILYKNFVLLNDESLYRTMDKLYPARGHIEKELAKRGENLFNLDTTLYLHDLTSTYFEGECSNNPQAKRGWLWSRQAA